MRFEFLFLGKTKEKYIAAGISEFAKRLNRYTPADIRILKEGKAKKKETENILIERESEILLQNVKGTCLVCLDRTGRQLDSLELATQVQQWEMQGQKKVTFVIGGPLGLSQKILSRADLVLSLSRLTLTHEMSRMLLLEQLYRAYTIKAGEKYHK